MRETHRKEENMDHVRAVESENRVTPCSFTHFSRFYQQLYPNDRRRQSLKLEIIGDPILAEGYPIDHAVFHKKVKVYHHIYLVL